MTSTHHRKHRRLTIHVPVRKNERNAYSREGNAQNESHPKDSPHEQINEVSSERGGRKVRGDENPSSSVITGTFSASYININRDEGTAQKTFSMMVPQHERTRSESKEMGRVRWHRSPPFRRNIFIACGHLGLLSQGISVVFLSLIRIIQCKYWVLLGEASCAGLWSRQNFLGIVCTRSQRYSRRAQIRSHPNFHVY